MPSLTDQPAALSGAADPFQDSFTPPAPEQREGEAVEFAEELDEDGVDIKQESPEAQSAPQSEQDTELETDSGDFDAALLKFAEGYGISAEEAKSYGEETLSKMVAAFDKQAAAYGHEYIESLKEPPQSETPPTETQQTPQAPQETPATLEKYELPEGLNDIDEELGKALAGLNEHYHSNLERFSGELKKRDEEIGLQTQVIAMLHQQLSQFTGQHQAEGSAQFAQDADTFFSSLDEGYAELFGKQPVTELPPDSPLLANRNKVVQEMYALEYADAKANRQFSRQDRLRRALALAFPDKIKSAARKEVLDKVQQRRSNSIARPSGHNGKGRTPDERARAFVADFYKQHAIEEDDYLDDGV